MTQLLEQLRHLAKDRDVDGLGAHRRRRPFLRAGMVMCVEPILLPPERGQAYHTEDLVLVTHDGYRLLTKPQRELLTVCQ